MDKRKHMNVEIKVCDKTYIVGLRDAKRILNNVYEGCDQVYVNGNKILVDQDERLEIMKQLHGVIYV